MAMSGAALGGAGGAGNAISGAGIGGSLGGPIGAGLNLVGSALPGLMQGFFGHSGRPYEKASEAYLPYFFQSERAQNPFYQAGVNAVPQYNAWLSRMNDPSSFINNLMMNYKESPWAKFQQDQMMRALTNQASATGLLGSTPMQLQAQQNAANISSQDMQNWLQNVLGINTMAGEGYGREIGYGQHAGDILSQLAANAGEYMGGAAYGKEAGEQQDRNALFGGIAKMFGG